MKYFNKEELEKFEKFSQELQENIQYKLDFLKEKFGSDFVEKRFGTSVCSGPLEISSDVVQWTWEETWTYCEHEPHYRQFPLKYVYSEKEFKKYILYIETKIFLKEKELNSPNKYIGAEI